MLVHVDGVCLVRLCHLKHLHVVVVVVLVAAGFRAWLSERLNVIAGNVAEPVGLLV